MPAGKPTPEEKLFAVIQGAKAAPIRGGGAAAWRAMGRRVATTVGPVTLPRINALLTGLMILLGVWALQPLVIRRDAAQVLRRVPIAARPLPPAPLEGLRPLEAYLPQLIAQDPFRVGPAPGIPDSPGPVEPVAPPAPDAHALASALRLVGISWGRDPTAMIEQNEETYFLKVGEPIGPFIVKQILADRVILRYEEEEVELF